MSGVDYAELAAKRIAELEAKLAAVQEAIDIKNEQLDTLEAEVARLRIDVKEITDCYHAMQREEMEQRGKAIAAEAKLSAVGALPDRIRAIAAEIRAENIPGWGNGLSDIADELAALLRGERK